jgi:hypothetical protein
MPKSKHQIPGRVRATYEFSAVWHVDAYADDRRAKTECYLSTKSPELHARVVPP